MLKKFWFCYELELGGIVLGWSGILSNVLYIILLTLILTFGGALIVSAIKAHNESKQSNLGETLEYKSNPAETVEKNLTLWNNSTLENNSTFGEALENNTALWKNSTLLNNSTFENNLNLGETLVNNSTPEDKNVADALGLGIALFIFIIVLIYAAFFLRLWASISLLYGTKKRDHKHILRFIIVDGIFVVLNLGLVIFGFKAIIYNIQMIYLSVCIYSLYLKIKNENENATNLSVTYQLAAGPNYPMIQNVTQAQPGGYQQPQGYPQVPAYQQPQPYQQAQAYQQPYYQENSKLAEANQLPSYNSVVPSASK